MKPLLIKGKSYDRPCATVEQARSVAAELSQKNHSNRYVIAAGDKFFVSTTKNVQHYESLVATYRNGKEVTT